MTEQDILKSFFDWIYVKSGGNIHQEQLHEAVATEIIGDVFDSHSDGQPIVDLLSEDEINRLVFARWKSHLRSLYSSCEKVDRVTLSYRDCKLNYPSEYLDVLKSELDQLETQCL